MRKNRKAEAANDALCFLAEKAFSLAEMLVDVLSQNGIDALAVGSDDNPLGALHGTIRTYERVFVKQEDFAKASKVAGELFGSDLDR